MIRAAIEAGRVVRRSSSSTTAAKATHASYLVRPPRIAARIAALEDELRDLRQQQRAEDDARLLRAIALSTRGAVFTVADLLARTRLDPDLREALRGLRPKPLGKRLARCVGRDVSGLSVRRVLATKDGWVWELHFHQGTGLCD